MAARCELAQANFWVRGRVYCDKAALAGRRHGSGALASFHDARRAIRLRPEGRAVELAAQLVGAAP